MTDVLGTQLDWGLVDGLNELLSMLTPEAWAAVEAAATALTALIAVLAAVFAFVQVRQARRLRVEQARPFVVVDFESSPVWQNAIQLVIQNIGQTIATDVAVSFDPPLESTDKHEGYELAKSALLTNGIPAMPPGKRVTALFDLSHRRKDSGLPMSYLARVTFSDYQGKQQDPLEYRLDLNFLYGLMRFREYGLHDAAKALREIEKTVGRWTDHSDGLRVYAVDEDARQFEDRWQMSEGVIFPHWVGPRLLAGRSLHASISTPSRCGNASTGRQRFWSLVIIIAGPCGSKYGLGPTSHSSMPMSCGDGAAFAS